jgi:DNA polymerase/3'-5' exonuclease PolX
VLEPAEQHRSLAFNLLATERLREAATLLEHQDDNPFRVAAYRRAADAVAALTDVDREYRAKAAADKLRKIAPKRFNPKGRI